jgi:acyl carrier protein
MSHSLLNIINTVRGHKGLPALASLSPEMRLREDCGFASIDLAELTVRIEETFEIDVFADGVVRTIGEIEQKLGPDASRGA